VDQNNYEFELILSEGWSASRKSIRVSTSLARSSMVRSPTLGNSWVEWSTF